MLLPRGLTTLLGFAVAATAADRHVLSASNSQVPISQKSSSETPIELGVGAIFLADGSLGPNQGEDKRTPSEVLRYQPRRSTGNDDRRMHPRFDPCTADNGDQTCPAGTLCCVDQGVTKCCRPEDIARATTTLRITSTRTVTVATGQPTSTATVTAIIWITINDLARKDVTSTVTITSVSRNAKRQAASYAYPTANAGSTITELTTVIVTRTVVVAAPAVVTVTNVVFSTTIVAPNAETTHLVTTTVFVPPGFVPPPAETSNPSSVLPPLPSTPSSPGTLRTATSAASGTSTILRTTQSSLSSQTQQTPAQTTRGLTTFSSTPSSRTTTPALAPLPTSQPEPDASGTGLSTVDIIGIALGSLAGLILILVAAFLFRRSVQRRRRAQAKMRQKLTSPNPPAPRTLAMAAIMPRGGPSKGGAGTAAGGLTTNGSEVSGTGSAASAGNSALQGEGEVRIIIKPAPKRRTQSSQLWPMPPGHRGQTYSLFVDEATTAGNTGYTTPQESGDWSIASENGSLHRASSQRSTDRGQSNTTLYRTTGQDVAMEMETLSVARPTTSVFEGAWDRETVSSTGRRDTRGSFPSPSTMLTPPPAWHGHAQARGWPSMESPIPEGAETPPDSRGRESPPAPVGYPQGSIGVGKAF